MKSDDVRTFHKVIQRTVLNTNILGFFPFAAAVSQQFAAKRFGKFRNTDTDRAGSNNTNGLSGNFKSYLNRLWFALPLCVHGTAECYGKQQE